MLVGWLGTLFLKIFYILQQQITEDIFHGIIKKLFAFFHFCFGKFFQFDYFKKTMLQYNAIFLSIEESCLFHSFMKNLELNLNSF